VRHIATGFRDDIIQNHAFPRSPAKAATDDPIDPMLEWRSSRLRRKRRRLRGIQVQTDHGGSFLFELRIVGCHVALQSMRFQIRLLPDARDQVFA
jgi:hypothetical protein